MNQRIVLFDGDCNLCNGMVRFILKRNESIYFATMQSASGIFLLKKFGFTVGSFDSLIFLDQQKVYIKSAAVLHIARYLHGLWPMLYIFTIIPPLIRDKVYQIIARYRYFWFGKKQYCKLPELNNSDRFIL
jgi:predicted DCC family thiol-disulfide oxidoreductase YuxK